MNLGNILVCGAELEKCVFCLPAWGQLAFSQACFQHGTSHRSWEHGKIFFRVLQVNTKKLVSSALPIKNRLEGRENNNKAASPLQCPFTLDLLV